MKNLKFHTIALLSLATLFFSGCIIITDDEHDDFFIPKADIEVHTYHSANHLSISGVEVTLYETFENAECYPHSAEVAQLFSNEGGIVTFSNLPVGREFFIRAQHTFNFQIGSVFLNESGIFIVDMRMW
jgi:hypothetical protein